MSVLAPSSCVTRKWAEERPRSASAALSRNSSGVTAGAGAGWGPQPAAKSAAAPAQRQRPRQGPRPQRRQLGCSRVCSPPPDGAAFCALRMNGSSIEVNSIGKMNFVAGLPPMSFSVSEVLQAHRAGVGLHRGLVNALHAQAEPFGAEDRGLALTLRFQNGRLLGALGAEHRRLTLALGEVDLRVALSLRLGDGGAARALGGELPVHRVLHVARRLHLLDLDAGDLHPPVGRHLVEFHLQLRVDPLALGENVVQVHLADHGAERRHRQRLRRRWKLLTFRIVS